MDLVLEDDDGVLGDGRRERLRFLPWKGGGVHELIIGSLHKLPSFLIQLFSEIRSSSFPLIYGSNNQIILERVYYNIIQLTRQSK